ncbi:MAG: ROK family protein [Candidatus Eisenbacteria bacterium]|nr:ROK family protein [Candidatus Eisenbacteria bacterium]
MRAYLGIDIGGTNIKAALVSKEGALVAFRSMPWSGGPAGDAVDVVSRLTQNLTNVNKDHEIVACGVGSAGLVDTSSGVVRLSPNLPEWHDVELRRMVAEALGLPTTIENDANAAAYGEYLAGAARGATNAVVLTIGTGIGGGLILNGALYRGGGFAGEVGHTTVERDGEPCLCGNAGCLERLASAEAVVRSVRRLISEGRESVLVTTETAAALTAKEVGEAAASGDAVAAEALEQVGRALGAGLANLVLTLDPDVIVIGGGVAAAGEPLLAPTRAEMARRCYCGSASLPRVVPAELGNTAGVVGAALLARDEFPHA